MTLSITSNKKKLIKNILAAAFWILVWQLGSMAIDQPLFLASPAAVVKTLFTLCGQAAFWSAIFYSMARILLGFFCALLLGILLAVLSSGFELIKILIAPLMSAVKSTPVASFIILAILWVGSKNLAFAISFLMALPIVYTNVLSGIEKTDEKLLSMARVFNVSLHKKILHIYIPQVMPYFRSACSISMGLCWKSGIAAEVIGIPSGSIGEKLYQAKIYLSTGEVFAWTLVIVVLSVLLEKLVLYCLKALDKNISGGGND